VYAGEGDQLVGLKSECTAKARAAEEVEMFQRDYYTAREFWTGPRRRKEENRCALRGD